MKLKLEELLNQDDDEALFTGGACHIFADELLKSLKTLGCHGFSFRRYGLPEKPGQHSLMQAEHVYLAKDDTMIDIKGIRSEKKMIHEKRSESGRDYQAFDCSHFDLFNVHEAAVNEDTAPVDYNLEQSCEKIFRSLPQRCVNRWGHRLDKENVEKCRERARRAISTLPQKYHPKAL